MDAIAESEMAQRIEPTLVASANLASFYTAAGRYKDAHQVLREAQQHNLDGMIIRGDVYYL